MPKDIAKNTILPNEDFFNAFQPITINKEPYEFNQRLTRALDYQNGLKLPNKKPSFLENNTINLASPVNQEVTYKKQTFELYENRAIIQGFEKTNRVRICGRFCQAESEAEIWKSDKKTYHYKGLMSCGSVWVCPVCRAKISAVRDLQNDLLFDLSHKNSLTMYFLTLTMSHHINQNQHENIKSVSTNFSKILAHRGFREGLQALIGSKDLHFLKSLEVNYSRINGFHPHLHIVLAVEDKEYILQQISDMIIHYWLLMFPDASSKNQVYRPVYEGEYLADYITKSALRYEITDSKTAKRGKTKLNINPVQIPDMIRLKDFSHYTKIELIEIYKLYIKYTKGLRSLTYSRKWKNAVDLSKYINEVSDAEILSNTDHLIQKLITVNSSLFKIFRDKNKILTFLKIVASADRGEWFGKEIKTEVKRTMNLTIKVDRSGYVSKVTSGQKRTFKNKLKTTK